MKKGWKEEGPGWAEPSIQWLFLPLLLLVPFLPFFSITRTYRVWPSESLEFSRVQAGQAISDPDPLFIAFCKFRVTPRSSKVKTQHYWPGRGIVILFSTMLRLYLRPMQFLSPTSFPGIGTAWFIVVGGGGLTCITSFNPQVAAVKGSLA